MAASAVAVTAMLAIGAYVLGGSVGASRPATIGAAATVASTRAPSKTNETPATAPPTTAPPTTAPPTTAPPTTAPPTTAPATTVVAAVTPGNAFPIQPATSVSYPRSHHDYPAADIFAPCGLPVVAPVSGTVQEVSLVDTWSSSSNTAESRGGLSFSIVGDDGVRYYGSHLGRIEPGVTPGARLGVGTPIGTVGESGNARGTGCHLHFGISTPCGPGDVLRRRGEFWPQEYLDAWRLGQQLSPAALVRNSSC